MLLEKIKHSCFSSSYYMKVQATLRRINATLAKVKEMWRWSFEFYQK